MVYLCNGDIAVSVLSCHAASQAKVTKITCNFLADVEDTADKTIPVYSHLFSKQSIIFQSVSPQSNGRTDCEQVPMVGACYNRPFTKTNLHKNPTDINNGRDLVGTVLNVSFDNCLLFFVRKIQPLISYSIQSLTYLLPICYTISIKSEKPFTANNHK